MDEFVSHLHEVIEKFNKLFGKEATARLADLTETEFTVEFSGRFATSHDVHAYFEDFEYDFDEDYRKLLRQVKAEQASPGVWRVRYLILS